MIGAPNERDIILCGKLGAVQTANGPRPENDDFHDPDLNMRRSEPRLRLRQRFAAATKSERLSGRILNQCPQVRSLRERGTRFVVAPHSFKNVGKQNILAWLIRLTTNSASLRAE